MVHVVHNMYKGKKKLYTMNQNDHLIGIVAYESERTRDPKIAQIEKTE